MQQSVTNGLEDDVAQINSTNRRRAAGHSASMDLSSLLFVDIDPELPGHNVTNWSNTVQLVKQP
jgi:hypothetical protein